jgi:hypothetical protein
MNKLKMLVLTALAAATVGTGALAAAPSASAQRPGCGALWRQYHAAWEVYRALVNTGYRNTMVAYEQKVLMDGYLRDVTDAGCR